MGLLSPSFGMVIYEASVEDPDGFIPRAVEGLKARCFDPRVAGAAEVAAGWSSAGAPYPPRIVHEEVVFGRHLHFAMVLERRRVPPALLKKHLALEEDRILNETSRTRLSTKQRRELKERVKLSLLAKTLPVPSVHECAWDLATGRLFLLATQEKVMAAFEELFHATFGLRHLPVTAGTLAVEWARSLDRLEELEGMSPEALV